MTLKLHNDIIDDQLDLIITAIDAGSGPGLFRVYSGSQPAKGGTETTILAEFTLDDPCGTVTVGHDLSFTLPADTVGLDDGTPTWGRLMDSDENFVADLTAGSDFTLNVADVETGQTVKVTAMAISSSNE